MLLRMRVRCPTRTSQRRGVQNQRWQAKQNPTRSLRYPLENGDHQWLGVTFKTRRSMPESGRTNWEFRGGAHICRHRNSWDSVAAALDAPEVMQRSSAVSRLSGDTRDMQVSAMEWREECKLLRMQMEAQDRRFRNWLALTVSALLVILAVVWIRGEGRIHEVEEEEQRLIRVVHDMEQQILNMTHENDTIAMTTTLVDNNWLPSHLEPQPTKAAETAEAKNSFGKKQKPQKKVRDVSSRAHYRSDKGVSLSVLV
ncbi:hypothetical protein AK812_SmicGene21791 [Symbiodinium microadriaticum]|uniref:Uncharacterized protein n=1 Tax=Symbiodinium microadriaticum TaxID=2951 RepID=A0A1Q9DLE4_SYMMI|nr:hypothetical protein AK812_SmicGene21791 [Symbiodinium microadriaticum]